MYVHTAPHLQDAGCCRDSVTNQNSVRYDSNTVSQYRHNVTPVNVASIECDMK